MGIMSPGQNVNVDYTKISSKYQELGVQAGKGNGESIVYICILVIYCCIRDYIDLSTLKQPKFLFSHLAFIGQAA